MYAMESQGLELKLQDFCTNICDTSRVPEVEQSAKFACKMLIILQDQLYHIIANLCLFIEPHKSSINIINFYDSFFVQLFLKSTQCPPPHSMKNGQGVDL